MNSRSLRPLVLIAAISGVIAVLLFVLLSFPVYDPFADDDPDVATAVSSALGWTVAKVLAAIAAAAGLLLLGLSPVVSALESVLAKQEALDRKVRALESPRTDPAIDARWDALPQLGRAEDLRQ